VGLITDGRFSGGTWGMVVGHVAPEAFVGGNDRLVNEGDSITIDAHKLQLELNVPDAELAQRKRAVDAPAARYTRGVQAKFRVQAAAPARARCWTTTEAKQPAHEKCPARAGHFFACISCAGSLRGGRRRRRRGSGGGGVLPPQPRPLLLELLEPPPQRPPRPLLLPLPLLFLLDFFLLLLLEQPRPPATCSISSRVKTRMLNSWLSKTVAGLQAPV
jgi:hypothetical protein